MIRITDNRATWQAIGGLIATLTLFSVTQGLSYPLLSRVLRREGASDFIIAVSAAMTPLGAVVSSQAITWLGQHIRRSSLLLASILVAAGLVAGLGATRDPAVWLVLRFLLGCAVNALYLVADTGVLQISPAPYRGRVCAASAAVTNAGYGVGPLILIVSGSVGWAPFGIAIGMLLLSIIPLVMSRRVLAQIEIGRQEKARVREFLPCGWAIIAAYAATMLFDNAFMSLLPLYGMATGFSDQEVSALLSIIFIGGIALQYPVGWIADRTSSRAVMLGCGVLSAAGFVLFPWVLTQRVLLWGFAAVWGGAVLGLQTVALAELATRFKGGLLNTGNAVLAIAWGLSALIGIPLAGAVMDAVGPRGLLLVVGGSFLIALLTMLGEFRHS